MSGLFKGTDYKYVPERSGRMSLLAQNVGQDRVLDKLRQDIMKLEEEVGDSPAGTGARLEKPNKTNDREQMKLLVSTIAPQYLDSFDQVFDDYVQEGHKIKDTVQVIKFLLENPIITPQ